MLVLIAVIIDGVDVAKSVHIFMFFLTVPAGILGAEFMQVLQGYGLLPTNEVFLAALVWFVYFCVGYIQWVWLVGGIITWLTNKCQAQRAAG